MNAAAAAPCFTRPNPLPANATIGIFAPSGAVDVSRLNTAVDRLRALGHRVVLAEGVDSQWRYFAGSDDTRVASFHKMLADPSVDVMMMARGGYGWSRILHRIDWQAVAESRKLFVGFSDFTAFNLAALAKARLVTMAGPGAAVDFGAPDDDPETRADQLWMAEHCWPVLRLEPLVAGPFTNDIPQPTVSVCGTLWGSNLSLLAHLVGTPYMPHIEGGIMVIEEVTERPYAIERMFMQLWHAGILQRQRLLILGDFSDCDPMPGRPPYTLSDVVETLRNLLPYPVLTGLPFGHVARKLTLPYGTEARVNIQNNTFTLGLNGA